MAPMSGASGAFADVVTASKTMVRMRKMLSVEVFGTSERSCMLSRADLDMSIVKVH